LYRYPAADDGGGRKKGKKKGGKKKKEPPVGGLYTRISGDPQRLKASGFKP
jgi:hypothetical protein